MKIAAGSGYRSRAALPAKGAARGTWFLALVVLAAVVGWFVYVRGPDAEVAFDPFKETVRGGVALNAIER